MFQCSASGDMSAAPAQGVFPSSPLPYPSSQSMALAQSLAQTDRQNLDSGVDDRLIPKKIDKMVDSPLTETDTGIGSMPVSSGEKMKKRLQESLDLGEASTDTDQEYSELSLASPMDPNLVGWRRIRLIVVGARKLEKKGVFGKADPYVTVSYADQTEQSNHIKDNLNPEWNFEKVIHLNESSEDIVIKVFDKDTVTKDDFMGRVSIPVSDVSKLTQGKWIPLEDCKSGDVLVAAEAVPAAPGRSHSPVEVTMRQLDKELEKDISQHSAHICLC